MAKKSRRRRQESQARELAGREAKSAAPRRREDAEVNFAEEYAYVYNDLKTIAIIAAVMLVLLVALSFVIV